ERSAVHCPTSPENVDTRVPSGTEFGRAAAKQDRGAGIAGRLQERSAPAALREERGTLTAGRPSGSGRERPGAGARGRTRSALCLPTATGALHKAVVSGDSRAHLVEEVQLFPRPEPVLNLQLAPSQGAVFAGFSGGVVRVPRANCSVYESCMDCVLARDPHCAWDPESRICRLLRIPVP
ncbi:semaphorin-4A-like, partial [Pteropus medius]|uniref:semaphorin-4A-like n=1 Tax=Pteropus vampyrus TaxID=132908 RepID=UPI00196A897F